jgi:membrane fusion protein (multidrug efflux system)
MNYHTKYLSLLLVLTLAAPVGACKRQSKAEPNKKNLALPVKAEPARAMDVSSHVFLSGEVLADVEVRVFSLIPERITKLNFEEGQVVKEGETMAVIKGGALWQSVQQAQAGLAAARTQKDLAKIELDRTAGLYQTNTVAVAMVQRAQAQYNVAESQVKQMEAAVGATYQNISNVVIKAPITGIVGQRFLSAGDLAGPGIPLCTIIQIDSVRVKAMATEFDLVQLKPKQPVAVTLPALPDRTWTGHVDFIAPVVDRMTRSAWVTVLVKNADQVLRPGMFGDLKVKVGQRAGVVMIPARAINRWVDEAGKVTHHVYLVKGGIATQRAVSVGRRDGELIEITKGLGVGEVVVVVGNHRLRDKMKVTVVKPTAAESGLPPAAAPPPAAPQRT